MNIHKVSNTLKSLDILHTVIALIAATHSLLPYLVDNRHMATSRESTFSIGSRFILSKISFFVVHKTRGTTDHFTMRACMGVTNDDPMANLTMILTEALQSLTSQCNKFAIETLSHILLLLVTVTACQPLICTEHRCSTRSPSLGEESNVGGEYLIIFVSCIFQPQNCLPLCTMQQMIADQFN